jgi:hypothetical protein
VQLGHQFERGQAEDGLEARTHRRVDLHARRQGQRGKAHQKNSFKGSRKIRLTAQAAADARGFIVAGTARRL